MSSTHESMWIIYLYFTICTWWIIICFMICIILSVLLYVHYYIFIIISLSLLSLSLLSLSLLYLIIIVSYHYYILSLLSVLNSKIIFHIIYRYMIHVTWKTIIRTNPIPNRNLLFTWANLVILNLVLLSYNLLIQIDLRTKKTAILEHI